MQTDRVVQWTAHAEIFAGFLALNPVTLKLTPSRQLFRVSQFCIMLDGGDTSLALADPTASPENDLFTRAILQESDRYSMYILTTDVSKKMRLAERLRLEA